MLGPLKQIQRRFFSDDNTFDGNCGLIREIVRGISIKESEIQIIKERGQIQHSKSWWWWKPLKFSTNFDLLNTGADKREEKPSYIYTNANTHGFLLGFEQLSALFYYNANEVSRRVIIATFKAKANAIAPLASQRDEIVKEGRQEGSRCARGISRQSIGSTRRK